MKLMKGLSAVGPAIAVLALCTLWVLNCSGPRPTVTQALLIPPRTKAGPYEAQALVYNDGPGPGQVDVTFRLRNTVTGQTVQTDSKVVLQSGETSRVIVSIPAPPGSYTLDVAASYPPG
jgi:hypothetical protein